VSAVAKAIELGTRLRDGSKRSEAGEGIRRSYTEGF
jgi:hypothetical protein